MEKLKGVGVSKGIAIGEVFLYLPEEIEVDIDERDNIPVSDKKKKLEITKDKSRKELQSIYEKMKSGKTEKEAGIFEAQALFVDDPTLDERIMELIEQGFTLTAAVKKAFGEAAEEMEKMENEYFKQRAKDIRDVSSRLIRHILDKPLPDLSYLPKSSIIVARDLTPSDTAGLDEKNVLGFATDAGGKTSHTAIIAEAIGIPAIVGLKNVTEKVKHGDSIIIDGETGEVFICPDDETRNEYTERKFKLEKEMEELRKISTLPLITKSGKRIEVAANIGSPKDADKALEMGAEGVGLYRTEFLFLDRNSPPTEEEQFKAYKAVLEKLNGKKVIIRTLDIGGDKQIPYLNLQKELNPFLGVRAIRLCFERVDLFKIQLRAILRASMYGKALIMYPMIALKEEVLKANEILNAVKEELTKEEIPFDKDIQVGIMVEIPSSALNAEEISDFVDFFSIGTNDLTQYTFAADRTNEALSYLYQPLNPALLKLVKMTIDASHKKGKWTGMCGELAGDPEAIPILVELGIDELSMAPSKIPFAKKIIKEL
jgi:phosphotransferase system enzyme I (PtsI)